MKKLSAILVATTLVASVGAFANVVRNDALPFAVNVPNVRSGFEFNVEGLFLKPSNSDLDYGFINDSTQDNLLSVKPDNHFGFGVGVGYVFPDSGNDVQLNWVSFDHTDTDFSRFPENSSNGFLNTPYGFVTELDDLSSNADVTTISGKTKSKLTAIDLDAGQYIDLGNRLQLRPFAGVRFARVESNLIGEYAGVDEGETDIVVYEEDDTFHSRFSGIGPLLGADAHYNLGNGIHATAHLATALLVGKVNAHSNYSFSEDRLDIPVGIDLKTAALSAQVLRPVAESTISSEDVTRVVPSLDAKLGLNYSYTFDCDSIFTVEGGYKVTQYIHAVDRLTGTFDEANGPLSVVRTTSSVGFSGPYVKLAVKL